MVSSCFSHVKHKVIHTESGSKGSFYIGENHERLAELNYTYAGNRRITVDSLQVTLELRDTGAERALVESYVKFVRSQELVSIPIDPLALSVFNLHPELGDVLIAKPA